MIMSNVLPYKTMRRATKTFANSNNTTHRGAYRLGCTFDAWERSNILTLECVLGNSLGFVMWCCIIGIPPFEPCGSLCDSRASIQNITCRHSKTSTCFSQRWEYGNIFAIEGNLDYCTPKLAIRYAFFTGNLSVGAIILGRTPFKVLNGIVGFVLVLMVHIRIVVWVRKKRFRYKTMDRSKFFLPMQGQHYATISVWVFARVYKFPVVDVIGTGIHAPHAANHIAAFIANYISPFFFFFHLLILYHADKLEKKRKGYQLTLVSRIANSAYPFSVTNILKINDLNKFYFNLETL